MLLYEDTRQQVYAGDKHDNIRSHCQQAGIEIKRIALPFGDYALADNVDINEISYTDRTGVDRTVTKTSIKAGSISIDTKQDLVEISGNIMHSKDHERFRRECIKAQEAGCQLVILIEEIPPCGMVDLWTPPVFQSTTRYHRAGQPVTRANPVLLRKCMETMTKKYGVKFAFCDRSQTGRVLMSILTGEYRL
jgi:hypothetical protein